MNQHWSPEFTQLTRDTFGLIMDRGRTHTNETDGPGLIAEGILAEDSSRFYAGFEGENDQHPITMTLDDEEEVTFVRIGHLNLEDDTLVKRDHYFTADGEVIGNYVKMDTCERVRLFKLDTGMMQTLLDEIST